MRTLYLHFQYYRTRRQFETTYQLYDPKIGEQVRIVVQHYRPHLKDEGRPGGWKKVTGHQHKTRHSVHSSDSDSLRQTKLFLFSELGIRVSP